MSVEVYRPNQRLQTNWFTTWKTMFANVIESKDLIFQLFKRDFFRAYRKSFLGIGWILLTPIIGIVSWLIMNSSGVLNPGDVGIPYPAYVLISSAIWGLFMSFYSASKGTLDAGKGIIMQVNFPHEALLVKQLLEQIVSFFITFIFNVIVLLLFGVSFHWQIIFFPFLLLPLLFLGTGIGLITSIINVVAVDIENILTRLLALGLYITPVIFADNVQNETMATIIKYNPLTYLIGAARDLIIYGHYDHMMIYLLISLGTFLFFLFSLRLFYVSETQVIEKMI